MSGLALVDGVPALLDVERARDLLRDSRDVETILAIRDAAKVAAEYRRVTGSGLEAQNEAVEIVLRAQRKIGEFLIDHGRKGRPEKDSTNGKVSPRELGLDHHESSRCQRLATLDDGVFEQHLVSVQGRGEKLTTSGTIAATSSAADYDSDEWYTPSEYVEAARDVMGGIDLDPASCPAAQVRIGARRSFTKSDDGLRKKWKGRVWLNPPYSQPAAADFAAKLLAEIDVGNVTQAVMVQNSGTDTAWFHRLAARSWICLHRGRINFLRVGGDSAANRYAQVFFYFGDHHDRFVEVFGRFGLVGQLRGNGE